MKIDFADFCPICGIGLTRHSSPGYIAFNCLSNNSTNIEAHYSHTILDNSKFVRVRLSQIKLIFTFGIQKETEVYKVRNNSGFGYEFLFSVPNHMEIDWNNLAAINNRIKNLLVFL
jgi:hypothetical protein